jgi:hypothetical protein
MPAGKASRVLPGAPETVEAEINDVCERFRKNWGKADEKAGIPAFNRGYKLSENRDGE